jgi:alpha-L-fucosidase
MSTAPRYLQDYAAIWERDPKEASLAWWKNARFGLFIHYGLYSQLGEGEWVQFHNRIPVSEYERLAESFAPTRFDADFITDLALESEMRYVNLVSCHHDSFCLWSSMAEPFNSVNSPARRDLVAELADACRRKGLGFFTYYTFMQNWRHPYFLSRDYFPTARPAYPQPEPQYRFSRVEDFARYVAYVRACLTELLTQFGPLAGMWLDLIMGYYAQPDLMPVEEIYAMIRELQPHILVSFKQGATGNEDFATPEHRFQSLEEKARERSGERAATVAREAWERNRHKHNEICATMQEQGWGYVENVEHRSEESVWSLLTHAGSHDCNLLLNVGPLPDGSIHPDDIAVLRATGKRIRSEGYPAT